MDLMKGSTADYVGFQETLSKNNTAKSGKSLSADYTDYADNHQGQKETVLTHYSFRLTLYCFESV